MAMASGGARIPLLTTYDLPRPEDWKAFQPFLRGVFSQWHPTSFELNGQTFSTAEQWMMFGKAELFADADVAKAILATTDPAEQKRLGQQVADFVQETWDGAKIGIVYAGSRAKFTQNEGALRQLKATHGKMLVEANPRDWVWGAGLSAEDPGIHDPRQWLGENLLGRILTKVRGEFD